MPPLYGEGLPRRFIGSGFLAVDFPVGRKIGGGLFVLGEVKRRTANQIVAPVTSSDIGRRTGSKSAGRSGKGVSNPDTGSLEIPT
jgi:hypothetical protein